MGKKQKDTSPQHLLEDFYNDPVVMDMIEVQIGEQTSDKLISELKPNEVFIYLIEDTTTPIGTLESINPYESNIIKSQLDVEEVTGALYYISLEDFNEESQKAIQILKNGQATEIE